MRPAPRAWKGPLACALALALAGLVASVRFARRAADAAERALDRAQGPAGTAWARRVPRRGRPALPGLRVLRARAAARCLAAGPGAGVLVGGPGGAAWLDPDSGRLQDLELEWDLPDSSVEAAAGRAGDLALGHRDGGVLWVQGARRELFVPPRPEAGRVRALAWCRGRLWVGSERGGLWWIEPRVGAAGQPTHAGLSRLRRIRALAGAAGELLVAAGDQGAAWDTGEGVRTHRFPGEQVLAAALVDGEAWLGTEVGLYHWRAGEDPRLVDSGDTVRSLAPGPGACLVGSQGGKVLLARPGGGLEELGQVEGPVRALLSRPGPRPRALVGTRAGVFRVEAGVREPLARAEGLAAAHVSALAPDPGGGLWVGYFDAGLERLDATGRSRGRWQDDRLWQVNRLLAPDPERVGLTGAVVATSRGVLRQAGVGFERLELAPGEAASPRWQAVLATSEGLWAAGKDGLVHRPRRGPSLALSAFHGLPSNKAYCLAAGGGELWVGTLGGLARVDEGVVMQTWRPGASRMPAGWTNALAWTPRALFVGTYGGGVARLDRGTQAISRLPGPVTEVNPGAALVVGDTVLMGGLQGLVAYDVSGRLRGGLRIGVPSIDVHALAARADALLVGTAQGIAEIPWPSLWDALGG